MDEWGGGGPLSASAPRALTYGVVDHERGRCVGIGVVVVVAAVGCPVRAGKGLEDHGCHQAHRQRQLGGEDDAAQRGRVLWRPAGPMATEATCACVRPRTPPQ